MTKIWNSHGSNVTGAMTSKEAIELAELNYTVRKDRVAVILPKDAEKSAKYLPNICATYRTDTLDTFGVVSDKYEIVQNDKAFEFMDSIVGEGKAIFETAGAIGNGGKIFITAKLPYYIKINGYDTIENYLVISNGHDGKTSLNVFLTPIRIVCQNTMATAMRHSKFKLRMRHTTGIGTRLDDAKRVLDVSSALTSELETTLKHLTTIKVTDETVDKYVNTIFLTQNELFELAAQDINYVNSSTISTRKKNMITEVRKYYHTGVGQSKIRGTAYGAYNALNGYLSNVRSYINEDRKMEGLIMGGLEHKMNSNALDLALTLGN